MSKQRIFIAGHRGMVGSAIKRQLEQRGDVELVLRTRDELNLLDSRAVDDFFASERIDRVSGGGESGRHCCQQYLSGGFHLPEHDD